MSWGILGIGACALSAAVLGAAVRSRSREMALALSLAAGGVILFAVARDLLPLAEELSRLTRDSGLEEGPFPAVLKAVGIALAGELVSHFCKDAGETGLAAAVELAGRAAILAVSLPLLTQVLSLIAEVAP